MTQPSDPAFDRPLPTPYPDSQPVSAGPREGAPLAPYGGGAMAARTSPRRVGVRRSAWGVWWLSALTFGIYYLVWYYKINAELRAFAPEAVEVSPGKAVLAQLLPIFAWVSLAHTSTRLNNAHRAINSPVRVSGGVAILGTFWFNSQTRYLQRRLNSLWDAQDTLSAGVRY
ncbi:DUF4234 domain-containing protein [Jatrophihabitans sp.]|uniref:DUF4234 domain-containing protein n=1 Tax=Jatrophihabitans sp. TaxID=1932789 RepID=UPI002B58646E|nr:DUF4234 domain-containing protein [Jatrophihabitans sp.]